MGSMSTCAPRRLYAIVQHPVGTRVKNFKTMRFYTTPIQDVNAIVTFTEYDVAQKWIQRVKAKHRTFCDILETTSEEIQYIADDLMKLPHVTL